MFNTGGCVPDSLESLVGQAVGAGSVCWENMSGTGVFQDQHAQQVVKDAVEWIEKYYTPNEDALAHLQASLDPGQEPLFDFADCG
jgi:predicted P-loop ATPase